MNRLWASALLAVLAFLWAVPGRADEPPIGPELDVRVAYAKPFGRVTTTPGDSLEGSVTDAFPVWIDAGWRASWRWFVGTYFSYAPVLVGSDLAAHGIQTGEDLRVGIEAIHHLFPHGGLNPWVGAGFGYEWLRFDSFAGKFGIRGWEFACLQGGVDLPVSPGIHIGPMLALTLGQYDWVFTPTGNSGSLSTVSAHGWVVFGIRGAFAPPALPRPVKQHDAAEP